MNRNERAQSHHKLLVPSFSRSLISNVLSLRVCLATISFRYMPDLLGIKVVGSTKARTSKLYHLKEDESDSHRYQSFVEIKNV